MQSWGVQIPVDYIGYAAFGCTIAITLMLLIGSQLYSRWVRRHLLDVAKEAFFGEKYEVSTGSAIAAAQDRESAVSDLRNQRERYSGYIEKLRGPLKAMNLATTLFALLPLIAAMVALTTEQTDRAFLFDITGLALLVVTKGVLWLLSFVLISRPGGVLGGGRKAFPTRLFMWLLNRDAGS